jgi:hypothetical protein
MVQLQSNKKQRSWLSPSAGSRALEGIIFLTCLIGLEVVVRNNTNNSNITNDIITQQQQQSTISLPASTPNTIMTTQKDTSEAISELKLANDFQLAYRESLGFFDDITTAHWRKLKTMTKSRVHHSSGYHRKTPKDPTFYQTNWDPDFSCLLEDSIGQLSADGHKWVCDPHRLATKDDCLVYSFGSNGNFFFEQHLQSVAPNCEIHVFDPKDYSGTK